MLSDSFVVHHIFQSGKIASETFTVRLLDANDHTPAFLNLPSTIDIREVCLF